jgi:uncharacterized 2Fe-2S/4Fe-4S cluster protein (DUF4445 family)
LPSIWSTVINAERSRKNNRLKLKKRKTSRTDTDCFWRLMMKYRVDIHQNGNVRTVMADRGDNLLELLKGIGILLYTPCGGRGTCGKCGVRIEYGMADLPEEMRLAAERSEAGFILACRYEIDSDICVYVGGSGEEASILTSGVRRDVGLDPFVSKKLIRMEPPSLADQRPDMERVMSFSGSYGTDELQLLREIPDLLRSSGYKVTTVSAGDRLLLVEAGDTTSVLYGAAFDIGTTTVAAYLYDLTGGKLMGVRSSVNPQCKFGADVISRIDHVKMSRQAAEEMKASITDCINGLIRQLAADSGIDTKCIYEAVFCGNTTMLHFLAGLDASGIAVSPFIPVTCRSMRFSANDLGIEINSRGCCILLPCVSAYIGADTVAAVLASGMYDMDGFSLLVDIGTNGEIVLGGKDGLIACSAAAGPAFEGANIRFGMGGVTGAIDSYSLPGFRYTVIGNTAARGICGSGTVDAVAALLDAGAIDETGAFADGSNAAGLPQEVSARFTETDGMRSFILVPEHETGGAGPITITQKDIREIQNAKAAVAAGIETLISEAGISHNDIKNVFLAGGFGSSMHIRSAARIGLLPRQLADRVVAVGNAAGSGASECLLSRKMLGIAEEIANSVKYIELSASALFTENYVENMLFGQ